jgi:PIN domain nuclease of toxin-antitoxin system
VKFIADTQAFLWFVTDSPRLSRRAKELLEAADSERLFSIASVWEIAIKTSIGKLSLAKPFAEFIPEQLQRNGFEILGLTVEHTAKVAVLPLHHRDPFDRMLVAQGLAESLPLLSCDDRLDAYGVQRLW